MDDIRGKIEKMEELGIKANILLKEKNKVGQQLAVELRPAIDSFADKYREIRNRYSGLDRKYVFLTRFRVDEISSLGVMFENLDYVDDCYGNTHYLNMLVNLEDLLDPTSFLSNMEK